ncbi:sensor histidine kinase [Mucilaginibacter gilvus]|uniref:Histidine kinase n=1 Tax=Mucilaginibacter gilvus TaxID=2305909 RepID=A0A444MJE5_9SPHI|nr:sensor histidine kinase [Mucilaginibacter gilvus]RWY48323.1 histidine kinase [Mucilaginibacter gilvus]
MERKRIVLVHIAFWAVLITGAFLRGYFSGKMLGLPLITFLITSISYYILSAICFYCSYFWVAPRLILKRQYLHALLLTALIWGIVIFARYALEFWFLKPVIHFDNYHDETPTVNYYISNIFFYYFPSYFIYGLMYFFAENWYKSGQRQQELQQEKLSTELAFLRSQINPHFLFNTINDIYSLTYQKSEQAPEALLKLSVMLRYMLREGNEDFMPLNREVEYLENVIALQRISAKGMAYVKFTQEGYLGDQPIASLLFIAFVENAFKHGIWNDPQHPIEIYLHSNNAEIIFSLSNKKSQGQKDNTGGIGLSNVQRRLKLMYPERHQLTITNNAHLYKVNLILKQN